MCEEKKLKQLQSKVELLESIEDILNCTEKFLKQLN
jgi:hypothetical protein